ncbi:hypothetical protein CYMTET_24892 [Cymbomonas tetramitiformis]|uniref:Uncharacterized protein n=1 Tax=Cymbomonas tetramitiformis TaxID=36881 RepID=A0AAE0FV59_9CHLO|nr:hypothetical protein CYMTET_24892 [Cymbomonas tetramitiformis]
MTDGNRAVALPSTEYLDVPMLWPTYFLKQGTSFQGFDGAMWTLVTLWAVTFAIGLYLQLHRIVGSPGPADEELTPLLPQHKKYAKYWQHYDTNQPPDIDDDGEQRLYQLGKMYLDAEKNRVKDKEDIAVLSVELHKLLNPEPPKKKGSKNKGKTPFKT